MHQPQVATPTQETQSAYGLAAIFCISTNARKTEKIPYFAGAPAGFFEQFVERCMDSLNVREQLKQLRANAPSEFDRFELEEAVAALDRLPEECLYNDVGQLIRIHNAITTSDANTGKMFLTALLLTLMIDFESRAAKRLYTNDIRDRFRLSFERIAKSLQNPEPGYLDPSNDVFLKDLAICRQKLFPAGAQVIEPTSSFHRSIMFRDGINQALGVFTLLLKTGGNYPWYQIHTHLSELEDFNEPGWDQCYLRIAGMLKLHPEIKGMWGGSWFYDPELERVSPRLCYLRIRPQSNGAYVFYSNVDIDGGALSTSKSRQDLYARGEYVPKSYTLIWPRKALIEWADAHLLGLSETGETPGASDR